MAVMAQQPSLDATSLSAKTQPVPSADSMALDSNINGTTNHHDDLFNNLATPVIENGTQSANPTPEPLPKFMDNTTQATDFSAVKDPITAPITEVASGIAPTAPFIPEHTADMETLPDPTATMTVPPAVEQPTSDARDELDTIPLSVEPTITAGETEPPLDTSTQMEQHVPESMDISEDVSTVPVTTAIDTTAPTSVSEHLPTPESATAQTSFEQSQKAPIAADPVPENLTAEVAPPPTAAIPSGGDADMPDAPTGKVRSRDEDDEDIPSAKRAKTDEEMPPPPSGPQAPEATPQTAPVVENGVTAADGAVAAVQPPPYVEPHRDWDTNPISTAQKRILQDALRKSKKIKVAAAFTIPVDAERLKIPTYYDVIKTPMDITTMENKLKGGNYGSIKDIAADMDQIVKNTETFNGRVHPVTEQGYNLRNYFFKVLDDIPTGEVAENAATAKKAKKAAPPPQPSKIQPPRRESRVVAQPPQETAGSPSQTFALDPDGKPLIRRTSTADGRPKREIHRPPPRDLMYGSAKPKKKKYQLELKFCEYVLSELKKKKHAAISWPFLQPVDPVALNIPTYHKIIKKPMDLSTVERNLSTGNYGTAKEFHADVQLIFANCFKFNPETDEVHKMGKAFQDLFNQIWEGKDDWMSQHAPPSEPQSTASSEDEADEEEEDAVTAHERRLLEIHQQIAALTAESTNIMQAATKSKRASPTAGGKKAKGGKQAKAKRTSTTKDVAPAKASKKAKPAKTKKLTLEEKRQVSEGIALLDEPNMRKAVQIIRNGVKALQHVNDDEIELDIDEIPEHVVYELWKFVKSIRGAGGSRLVGDLEPEDDEYEPPMGGRAGHKSAAAGSKKKNKPMTAEQQESKIDLINAQLAAFNGQGRHPGTMSSDATPQEESDDDAESGSESEEE